MFFVYKFELVVVFCSDTQQAKSDLNADVASKIKDIVSDELLKEVNESINKTEVIMTEEVEDLDTLTEILMEIFEVDIVEVETEIKTETEISFICSSATCDDGNICTEDKCVDNLCLHISINNCCVTVEECDDNNACTIDSCTVTNFCQYTTKICDNANICDGLETCDSLFGCQAGQALGCNDGNQCTDDFCSPIQGCLNIN